MRSLVLKPHLLKSHPVYIDRQRVGNTGCWRYSLEDSIVVDEEAVATPLIFDYDYNTDHYYNWIEHLIGVRPDDMIEVDDLIYPYCGGDKIYLTPSEHKILDRKLEKDKLDRKVVSYNTLAPKALETLRGVSYNKKGDTTIASGIDLTGIYLRERIDSLVEDGYVGYNLLHTVVPLIREIAEYMNLEVSEHNGTLLVKSQQLFGCEVKSWLDRFVNRCILNYSPEEIVYDHQDRTPDIQVRVSNDGVIVEDTLIIKIQRQDNNQDKSLELKALFIKLWKEGYFDNPWGKFYTSLTGKISVLYFFNTLVFSTTAEAIEHLSKA